MKLYMTKYEIGKEALESVLNGGIATAKSYVRNVAASYVGAINFEEIGTGDWIDRDRLKAANESWYSVGTIAGAISAGVGTALEQPGTRRI
jgi:hypothetical protein